MVFLKIVAFTNKSAVVRIMAPKRAQSLKKSPKRPSFNKQVMLPGEPEEEEERADVRLPTTAHLTERVVTRVFPDTSHCGAESEKPEETEGNSLADYGTLDHCSAKNSRGLGRSRSGKRGQGRRGQ